MKRNMSNLALLIFAFLLIINDYALGQNESLPKDSPENIHDSKNKSIDHINRHIDAMNDQVKKILVNISMDAEKLKDKAANLVDLCYDDFFSTQQNVNSEITNGFIDTLEIDMASCTDMSVNFRLASYSALEKTRHCLADKIKITDDQVQNIIEISKKILDKLDILKGEVESCAKSMDENKTSAPEALQCVIQLSNKSTWFMMRKVHPFYLNIFKIHQEISNLIPNLGTCSTINVNRSENSMEIVERIQTCIETQQTSVKLKSNSE